MSRRRQHAVRLTVEPLEPRVMFSITVASLADLGYQVNFPERTDS
jgi:hypothetical protein